MANFRCEGLVCLVTGATSGIGHATCTALSDAGAEAVVAVGRDESRGAAVTEEVRTRGTSCSFHAADLRERAACERVVAAALELHGRVDVLVHAAGVFDTAPLGSMTDDVWKNTMAIHTDAFFYLSRALAPHMAERRSGALLAVAANYGLVGAEECTAYCASKGAVVAMVKAMALELADKNVRVNCVCPGATQTPMLGSPDEVVSWAAKSPSKELVQPQDVANALVYLASPAARMVRGAAWLLDGAETAGCRA